MGFEFGFVKKYLTPRRKDLSVSLIAFLSVGVITLVVWLVVLFLSITEGIEKNWIHKLTALNAPIRIIPTTEYYNSYYYQIDQYSNASHYLSKTLGEKARVVISDPYDKEFDETLPKSVPPKQHDAQGNLIDPVKRLTNILNRWDLNYQDVQMSGALLKLELLRIDNALNPQQMQRELTHVSFLASFAEKNPQLKDLILPPTNGDFNHLFYLARQGLFPIENLLENLELSQLKPQSDIWQLKKQLLPRHTPLKASAYEHKGEISHILIPTKKGGEGKGSIEKRGDSLFYTVPGEGEILLNDEIPLFSFGPLSFDVITPPSKDSVEIKGTIQEKAIVGTVPIAGLEIAQANPSEERGKYPPLWVYPKKDEQGKDGTFQLPYIAGKSGVLLAKSFQEGGVRIGDSGYLAYAKTNLTRPGEQKLPIYVAGFYDPGVMSVGNRCLLVSPEITRIINASETAFTLDKKESNAFFVWLPKLGETSKVKERLLEEIAKAEISPYFEVEEYHDYDFAKDLMQQFRSDKYLFTLIGGVILIVACTNIISLLVLLVSDKKKEIGILRAMGAKKRSIGMIFAMSGASLGIFGCLLGLGLAYLTLCNIDHLVHFLSLLQGHEAFHPQFFGASLPNTVSPRALFFAALATPLLAILAGLVPAIKASKLNTCDTLRSG